MLTSTPCLELLQALLAARLAFPPITRNCEAWSPKSKKTYPYADLNAIIDATVPILGAHGILVVQAAEDGEPGLMCVTTTLFHVTSGQWMRSTISFERCANPQEAGSQITYYKRFGLAAILSLSTETDDDASSLNGSHTPEKPAAAEKLRPSVPVNGNGHTPAPEPDAGLEHPTIAHMEALEQLVTVQCGADHEELDGRIRHTLGLRPGASTSPRLMVRVLSMEQYMTIFAHFTKVAEQLAKSRKEVSPDGPVVSPQEIPASTKPKPPIEEPTAVTPEVGAAPHDSPDASSSATAEIGAAELDRVRLRQEIQAWDLRISPDEIEHVIGHNSYSRARTLLWGARRQPPEPALAS